MSVALACTWNPRGELPRLQRALPLLLKNYLKISVCLPPQADRSILKAMNPPAGVRMFFSPDWTWGRHLAVADALDSQATHIQYVDMDRLLRWMETKPHEWRESIGAVQKADCLLFGRTDDAYQTHPRALRDTERISNSLFSSLLGLDVDLSAGAKGFSRQAAAYLMEHSQPGRSLGIDAEWPVLLHQAGYPISILWVEGLDWESADRYRQEAADRQTQIKAAEAYDQDPMNWAWRVKVALEIVESGLSVYLRNHKE